jgi:hypothetical protein
LTTVPWVRDRHHQRIDVRSGVDGIEGSVLPLGELFHNAVGAHVHVRKGAKAMCDRFVV